jgi:hypothetical protein
VSTVSRRANFTFAAGAALVATSLTLAFWPPSAGAQPVAPPAGHSTAPAAKKGDNGTIKIHNSTTPVTDPRNEPHVCVFYLDAFGFDPGQSVSWQIESWPPTGDRTVVDQGTLTLDSAGDGRTSDQTLPNGHYKLFWTFAGEHGAAKQKSVLGVLPFPDPHPDPDADVVLTDPDPDSGVVLARPGPGAGVVLAEPGPEPDVFCRTRSGTYAGAGHPSRDGLRHWALTTGGSRAAISSVSAGWRAPSAGRQAMTMTFEPSGSSGPADCGGRWAPVLR